MAAVKFVNVSFAAGRNDIAEPDRTIAAEYLDYWNIAMRAMSTRQQDRFVSVSHFAKAVRNARRYGESRSLTERALRLCQTGEATGNYDFFSQAVYCAEEALAIWGGNSQALESIPAIQASYAEVAMHRGDLDLSRFPP